MSRPYRQQSRLKEAERLSGMTPDAFTRHLKILNVIDGLCAPGPIARRGNQESERD